MVTSAGAGSESDGDCEEDRTCSPVRSIQVLHGRIVTRIFLRGSVYRLPLGNLSPSGQNISLGSGGLRWVPFNWEIGL
jgi:hypothetical protein